jgi:hypothetical protein
MKTKKMKMRMKKMTKAKAKAMNRYHNPTKQSINNNNQQPHFLPNHSRYKLMEINHRHHNLSEGIGEEVN